MEYLHNKDLSYFEDYNTNHKSTPHFYVAEGLEEIQETLQELNIPVAMVYNGETENGKVRKFSCFKVFKVSSTTTKMPKIICH